MSFSLVRFVLPAFDSPSEAVQMGLIKEAAARHGVRAKLSGTEIYREGLNQPPRFLLNMESYPKVWSFLSSRLYLTVLFSYLLVRVSVWRPSLLRSETRT